MTLAVLAPGLKGALPFLLAGTVLLVAALVLWIAGVVRRAREAAEFEDNAGGTAPGDEPARAPAAEIDLDAIHLKLRRSFREGLERLRTIRGRDGRYEVPWVLVAGEPRAGKTAALLGCGLERPYDESAPGNEPAGERDPLRWEFYDQGVALDLKGDLFLRADGSVYEDGWNHFLRLLTRHRPQRPLDGIVVTLPCSVLRGPAAREQAAARGDVVGLRLRDVQRALGVRIPVYLLVTRCDELPGFASMAAQLPEAARDEAFGWASPQSVEAAFRPEWVDAAIEEMHAALLGTQAELLASAQDPDGVFQLPGEVKSLAPGLRAFLEEVFRESVYHESFFFRGLYLSGTADPAAAHTAAAVDAAREQGTGDRGQPDAAAGAAADGELSELVPEPVLARPVFLRDFLGGKVFAERNLARRAAGGRFGRDRRVLAAQAAMALLVVVGGLGLWLDQSRLVNRSAEITGRLNEVAARVRPLERQDRETDVLSLLDQVEQTDPSPLFSFFAPTSWVDPLRRRVGRVSAGAFSDVILPAMRDSLEQRAERLAPTGRIHLAGLSPAGPGRGGPPSAATVAAYLKDLGELSANVRRFNTLASRDSGRVDELDSVVAYVFGESPRHSREDSHVLAGALRRSGTRPIAGESHTDVAIARADSLTAAAYDRLLQQVAALQTDVTAASGAAPGQIPLDQYRRMAGRVDSVRGYVTSDWLNPGGGLPPELQTLLRAIPNSGVISGQTLAAAYPRAFAGIRSAKLQVARQTLGGTYTAAAGLPDSLSGAGDDASSSALALRQALEALKGRNFMGNGAPVSLLAPQPAGTWTVWNLRGLDDALGLYAGYQAYGRQGLNGVTGGARNLVQGLATVALEARMTQAIAAARAWVPMARPFGLPARERDLRTRAAAQRQATERILKLLAAFDSLGLNRPYTELSTLLVEQNTALLGDAEKLLIDSGPYAATDPDFSGWNGQKPVAPPAFGVADAEELEGYLAQQRARVQSIAQGIAAPLLSDFENPAFDAYDRDNGLRGQRGPAEAVRWRGVVQALDGFDAKAPGNSLVALEQFIRSGMDAVDLADCDGSLGRRRAVLDLFGQLRERLREPLLARCRTLAASRVAGAYNRLRAQFQAELAGRYPFAAPGAANGDADVDAVRRFYRAMDANAWADSLVRSGRAGVGGPGSEAAAFLDDMEAARPFLASLLGADTTGAAAFNVMAEFRAARARERGGEQIAEWWLEIGADRLTQRDSAGTFSPWRAGDAVRLGVRWAIDSPLRPIPQGLAAPGRVYDRTVSWSFGGDWALLRLISALAAGSADLGGTPARQRHMLVLSVPTLPVVPDSGAVPERARVFVRLRLRDPVSGAERALPSFPPYAPALRSYGYRGGDVSGMGDVGRSGSASPEWQKWTEGRAGSPAPDDAVAMRRSGMETGIRETWTRLVRWWNGGAR